jgi:hypothetical protein
MNNNLKRAIYKKRIPYNLSLSGNVDVSKDLFIILEMGFATTDLDILRF